MERDRTKSTSWWKDVEIGDELDEIIVLELRYVTLCRKEGHLPLGVIINYAGIYSI